MANRFRLKPDQRLHRNVDFSTIRNTGKPYRCPYFALYVLARASSKEGIRSARIGISASRRVGNAIIRNKAKRRFRELFRQRQFEISPDADLILSIRSQAGKATFRKLEQRFLHALQYTGVSTRKGSVDGS